MILKDDCATIENLAEWELFFKDNEDKPMYLYDLFDLITRECFKVTKKQVKEKLQIKQEQDFFDFKKEDLKKIYNRLPRYVTGYQERYKRKGIFMVPVNVLTINKSIQELYALGKWCGLWS